MKDKNENISNEADEILIQYKGKLSTMLIKKTIKDGIEKDIPIITLFNKVETANTQRKNNHIIITYDSFYQELHVEKHMKDRTEYITQYLDGMKVIDERKYVIKRKGGE